MPHFVVPLWAALLVAAALIFLAWNVAVSSAPRWAKEAAVVVATVLAVLLLLGAFGYGPLYRPGPPAARAGCHGVHVCVKLP